MRTVVYLLALLCNGALFGFFFTMSFSIMPGFDLTEPNSAPLANQEIGRATQQSYFAVALLGTPITLLLLTALMSRSGLAAEVFWLATSFVAFIATMIVTFTLNVPPKPNS